jgi:Glycosyl hydrolase family 65, N-terminal domain
MLTMLQVLPASSANSSNQLWYQQPAREWTEALPVGNGTLGAMVFGRTDEERIQLNEHSLWSGGPQDSDPDAAACGRRPQITGSHQIRRGTDLETVRRTEILLRDPDRPLQNYITLQNKALRTIYRKAAM